MASTAASTFQQASAPPLREPAFTMEEPPKYSDIVPVRRSGPASETTRLYQSAQATVAGQQPTVARRQRTVARRQQETVNDNGERHFDMGRFVLCWTGLSTQASKITYHLCCWWYLAVGAFGAAGATLPFVIFTPGDVRWNSTIWWGSTPAFVTESRLEYTYIYQFILFEVAGAACVIMLVMWCFTMLFFRCNHPNKECYESKFRFRKTVNTGPIVCCFMIACFLFGSVTVAMMGNIISTCNLFTTPSIYNIDCYLFFPTGNYFMWYAIINTSAMTAVMFGFLCLNCLCYFTCVRPNAGHAFC